MNTSRRDTYKLLRAVLWMVIVQTTLICVMMLVGKTRTVDMLAFVREITSERSTLYLYDPQHNLYLKPFPDRVIQTFRLSSIGRIAFLSWDGDHTGLFVWDTQSPHTPPIDISRNPGTNEYPLNWSQDGQYLAFESPRDTDIGLYVWDGEVTHDVTYDILTNNPPYYSVAWSNDGRFGMCQGF